MTKKINIGPLSLSINLVPWAMRSFYMRRGNIWVRILWVGPLAILMARS
jgi:hypothetical protein